MMTGMSTHLCAIIAEDNSLLRGVVVDYLATFGIATIEATTAHDILHWLEQGQADVLVLDLVLKGSRTMLPLVEALKKDSDLQNIPIIITTAFHLNHLEKTEQAEALAQCHILPKPYDLCQLRRAIVGAAGSARRHVRNVV